MPHPPASDAIPGTAHPSLAATPAPTDGAASTPAAAAISTHLDRLNAAQRRAVVFGSTGNATPHDSPPLLIIAGAGTGKTTTLAHRVAECVLRGVDPGRILLLTFTRRAAREMARRAERIVAQALRADGGGRRSAPGTLRWAGTFHAVANRLLRLYAPAIGLEPSFTILDRGDAEDLLDVVRHQAGLSRRSKRFPRKATCLAIYSRRVNSGAPLKECLDAAFPWCAEWEDELGALFRAYVEAKQEQALLDYDDLLLYWFHLMQEPALTRAVGGRFDQVLVDEYQDTNALQADILLALCPRGAGLTVVGDDAQSIYAFRAATVRNILDFPGRCEPPAEVITLEQNYRSTQPILDAANAVIRFARERYTKDLFSERASQQKPRMVTVEDEAAQVDYVVERVLEAREAGLPLRRQAVLFRTAHHSDLLQIELARRNIPFVVYGGLRFLEAAHVKDLLCVLRWAENPRDGVAAFRTLQLFAGIGPAAAQRILDRILTAESRATAGPGGTAASEGKTSDATTRVAKTSGSSSLVAASEGTTSDAADDGRGEHGPDVGGSPSSSASPLRRLAAVEPPAAARQDWPAFAALMESLGNDSDWPGQVGEARRWYRPHLERLYDAPAVRLGDLEQMELIAAQYPSRERFLTELTLDPPAASGDLAGPPYLDEDYLILSTIHSAKGQEWDHVHVLNLVDGCIPSDMAAGSAEEIEEERRLLYVAMTRARDELHLMHPLRFYIHRQPRHGDRHLYAPRSRFLPGSISRCFETVAWGHPRPTGDAVSIPAAGGRHPGEVGTPAPVDIAARLREMW